MKLQYAPQAHRHQNLFRPTLETLESRWCPSCTFALQPNSGNHNELLIRGDDAADSIQIIAHGAAEKGKADQVDVVCSSDKPSGEPTSHTFADVARLKVQT